MNSGMCTSSVTSARAFSYLAMNAVVDSDGGGWWFGRWRVVVAND